MEADCGDDSGCRKELPSDVTKEPAILAATTALRWSALASAWRAFSALFLNSSYALRRLALTHALDVAQAAVLGHSLLLRDGAGHGEALLNALLREGGRGAHEHDGRLVRLHLRLQLGEELVLLEGPRRFHLAGGQEGEEDSRLASQCGWNEIVLVCVHTDSLRLQVGERPRDILEGVKSGGNQLGVIAAPPLQQ